MYCFTFRENDLFSKWDNGIIADIRLRIFYICFLLLWTIGRCEQKEELLRPQEI